MIQEDISLEDIEANPNKYGAPTFEEYKRDRAKYMGRDDEAFEQVDRGSTVMKNQIQRQVFEIEGYRCKTLEEVERVASAQGIPIKELDYRPQIVPVGGGKFNMLVKFVSKNEREKRERDGN